MPTEEALSTAASATIAEQPGVPHLHHAALILLDKFGDTPYVGKVMRKQQYNQKRNTMNGSTLAPSRMLSAVINLIIVAVASAKAVACGAAP